jgi:hypothetical protein
MQSGDKIVCLELEAWEMADVSTACSEEIS